MSEKAPEKKPTQVKRVDVVLKKPHTHAGEDKIKGDKITVTDGQAAWLKERKII